MKASIHRPTYIEVDLSAISYNLGQVVAQLPAQTQVFAVVKANAYGHGVLPVAQTLLDQVDGFCVSNIDEALLRKGRLIAKYEFGKLTAEKAAHLSASIGFSNPVSEPMTLAEIYNQQEMHFHNLKEKRKIGF